MRHRKGCRKEKESSHRETTLRFSSAAQLLHCSGSASCPNGTESHVTTCPMSPLLLQQTMPVFPPARSAGLVARSSPLAWTKQQHSQDSSMGCTTAPLERLKPITGSSLVACSPIIVHQQCQAPIVPSCFPKAGEDQEKELEEEGRDSEGFCHTISPSPSFLFSC